MARNAKHVLENKCNEDVAVERYKLCVVGDSETGKTSLLNALVKSDFEVRGQNVNYFPTSHPTLPYTNAQFKIYTNKNYQKLSNESLKNW